jgi:N-methylhydantoinase A
MSLDVAIAEKAIEETIAKPLGLNVVEAAAAISSLVEDNMATAIFLEAVKKGLDPRDFALVVGGGAGPVHSVAVAAKLGIRQVYIPKQAAVFCAFGAALADYTYMLNRFLYKRDDQVDLEEVRALYDSLEEEGRAVLARQGVQPEDMKLIRGAEMRYYGQLNDVSVSIPNGGHGDDFSADTLRELIQTFHDQHKALFGWSDPAMPTVLAMLKLQAVGIRPPLTVLKRPAVAEDASAALKRRRSVYMKQLGRFEETPCYDADLLRHGHRIRGPAIVEETKTTVVLPPGAELTIDAYENYLVTLSSEALQ